MLKQPQNSSLPFILASSFMKHVILAVNRQHAVLESALPVMSSANGHLTSGGPTYHLFFTRWTLSYMQSMI